MTQPIAPMDMVRHRFEDWHGLVTAVLKAPQGDDICAVVRREGIDDLVRADMAFLQNEGPASPLQLTMIDARAAVICNGTPVGSLPFRAARSDEFAIFVSGSQLAAVGAWRTSGPPLPGPEVIGAVAFLDEVLARSREELVSAISASRVVLPIRRAFDGGRELTITCYDATADQLPALALIQGWRAAEGGGSVI